MRKLLTLTLLFLLTGCQSGSQQTESRNAGDDQNPLRKVELITPSGDTIETKLAITAQEQETGLSGTQSDDFDEDEGMLFFYQNAGEKLFWMPDTYFDLDLFYLDKSLVIQDIIRKLPHYIGRANPDLIPRARGVWARHVLEMKSTSEIAQRLKIGDKLQWKGKKSLQETEEQVRKLGIGL